jgi:DNA-binding response OmpR family regulator
MTIANLRQKIERNPADPRIILTVKGVGYAWGEP